MNKFSSKKIVFYNFFLFLRRITSCPLLRIIIVIIKRRIIKRNSTFHRVNVLITAILWNHMETSNLHTRYIQDRTVRHTSHVRLPVTILYIAFPRRVARMDDFHNDLQEKSLGRSSIKHQNGGYYDPYEARYRLWRCKLIPFTERRRNQGKKEITFLRGIN